MSLSAKHLDFCQNVAAGYTQTEAYIKAGYAPHAARKNASRLMTKDDITFEIGRLQAKSSYKAEITHEWLVEQQNKLYELATKKGDLNTARACLSEITKLNGHYAAIKTENKTEVKGSMEVNTNELQTVALQNLMDKARQDRDVSTH
jgi:phage terminase small subunit